MHLKFPHPICKVGRVIFLIPLPSFPFPFPFVLIFFVTPFLLVLLPIISYVWYFFLPFLFSSTLFLLLPISFFLPLVPVVPLLILLILLLLHSLILFVLLLASCYNSSMTSILFFTCLSHISVLFFHISFPSSNPPPPLLHSNPILSFH